MSDNEESGGSVTTTVELSGTYEDVVDILGVEATEYSELSVVTEDLAAVLDVVARTGGATKSAIAAESNPSVDMDAEAVIHALRVLELYDLVRLDGNTWKPGPALPGE
ncbi:MAG: hypothetical protein V5A44_00390 [Haloarculaceae archaeon]